MAAYAKDIGLDLGCELYCDSSAALGIAQRAGIGKVRHLRIQGLWIRRIKYIKVLGSKNPADLMTKHMSAELSKQHIETLNMKAEGGRAESAPTLDSVTSYVRAWWEDWEVDTKEEIAGGDRKTAGSESDRVVKPCRVRFHPKAQYPGYTRRG